MAFDFPASPTLGQSSNGYVWDGQKWVKQSVDAQYAPGDYPSRAALAMAAVPLTQTHVRTAGYYAAGDGGGALYKNVASEPVHAGKVQSAGGAWWEICGDTIRVQQFGAKGDGVTNDSAAINDAVAYMRLLPDNSKPVLSFAGDPQKRNFRIGTPLNFTGLRTLRFSVDFANAVLLGFTNGNPVIDALDSQFVSFGNGTIYGDATAKPNYGIQMGRGIVANDAANNFMSNMFLNGYYGTAAFLNSGCEVFKADKCLFWNSFIDGHCVIQDGRNAMHVTSTFFTVTSLPDTFVSFNDNLFLNCNYEQIGGGPVKLGRALRVIGHTNSHCHKSCYAQNEYGPAVELSYDHHALELDIHCEATHVVSNVLMKTSAAAMSLTNFRMTEYYNFSTSAVITAEVANSVGFFNSEITIDDTSTSVPVFGAAGAINFHGTLKLGQGASIYDLTNLDAFVGTVKSRLPETSLTLPTIRSASVAAQNSVRHSYYGIHQFIDGPQFLPGPGLTAASTMTIPDAGSWFWVTGLTTINALSYSPSRDTGRLIVLSFGEATTLKNSGAGKTILAGDFVTAMWRQITLFGNGTHWQEIARSNNFAA